MLNKIAILIFLSLFFLYSTQVTILGPPTVVSKVKELADGSKNTFLFKSIKELDIQLVILVKCPMAKH